MNEFQGSALSRDAEAAASLGQDTVHAQELKDFQSAVARLIGPFAEMARLLSPVDPRGTVIERGDKVLEVRHFHNLKTLFETLTQAEAARASEGNRSLQQRQ